MSTDPFFERLNTLPCVIRSRIWADYFRLNAEEHGDKFIEVHDELTDYTVKVKIGDKLVLKLCRANLYYDIVDIDDLWLNAYIYKYAIESQIKRDCLRLLEEHKAVVVKQPVLRCGNVIVKICDGFYEGDGITNTPKKLEYYLSKIPSFKDYSEDMNVFDRRYPANIEWLSYVCPLSDVGLQNSGISRVGRGVSGRGLGALGFDSGTNLGSESESEDDWYSDEESE
jgi:hypothetical protein